MLTGLLLLASFDSFAQAKTATKSDCQKWKIRLRAIDAIPPGSSYTVTPGNEVEIVSSIMPELDFTYFFTKNIAAQLILGTTCHKVNSVTSGTETGLGKVWLLPPTLNVQYHIPLKGVEPYLGCNCYSTNN